ncbi:MAG: tetraacyldisaccharide 4'-kinase [Bryobacteraceae bacterium]
MSLSIAYAIGILKRTINATRLIFFLYQALQAVLSPAAILYLLYRGFRNPAYFRDIWERFGFLPAAIQPTGAGTIWLHAVSVGEILSAVEIARLLRSQHPSVQIFVSTGTLAGRATAEQKLAGLADGIFFLPIDYRSCVRRVLRRLRPSLVVILETEIWPNLYREAKRAGASLIVANGRISDRTAQRYKSWSWFFGAVLQWPDAIFVQTEEDARRYIAAGAPSGRVHVGGNLKYDFNPPANGIQPDVAAFLDQTAPSRIWIAASTMPPMQGGDVDEDDAVIAAFQQIAQPGLLLILVPRKPERFAEAAVKLEKGVIAYVRRTALAPLTLPGVLLLDTIGELAALFERADVVFMGGTLAHRGGHNILEPAYFGKPVIVGPHMENFAAIAEEFRTGGGVQTISSPAELAAAVRELLLYPGGIGERARTLAQAKRGVTLALTRHLWEAFSQAVPEPEQPWPQRLFLVPLTWIWQAGHLRNMVKGLAAAQRLRTRVVSIGGLTMGGAGKTPVVAHLAVKLREAGYNPAILTRGYKRKSSERMVIIPRGESAPVSMTGDEAQMFVRAGDAHIGIAKDRFAVGQEMEKQLHPDIFLLDDGFQHMRLRRDCDIVLIDALHPFGGGVFPLGRARESAAALERAHAVIITRAEPGLSYSGLERAIHAASPSIPVFRSSVRPAYWVDAGTGEQIPLAALPFTRLGAFCGLGNPRSFWRTLTDPKQIDLKLDIAFRWAFGDHHTYLSEEIQRLTELAKRDGAQAIVTTEKDALNLCDRAAELVAPLKLYWLKIGVTIENEEELLRLLLTSKPRQ